MVRTAILVDELLEEAAQAEQQHRQRQQQQSDSISGSRPRPVVVAQVRSTGAQATVQFACDSRVLTVPSKQLNAGRLARLLQLPAAAAVYHSVADFGSTAHLAVWPAPEQLLSMTVEQAQLHMPTATLLGLQRGGREGQLPPAMLLCPPADTLLLPGDCPVVLCGQQLELAASTDAVPAWEKEEGANGSGSSSGSGPSYEPAWRSSSRTRAAPSIAVPERYSRPVELTQSWSGEASSSSSSGGGGGGGANGAAPSASSIGGEAEYVLPQQYLGRSSEPQRVLVCGWSDPDLMLALLRALDQGPQVSWARCFRCRLAAQCGFRLGGV